AVKKVIPAMQRGAWSEVTAIASRDLSKARQAAVPLGIAKAYGSYEELLADPAVDAIYNPLPNHLHVPWSIRAAEAGKHVLCEKPIGLTAAESLELIRVRNRTGVKIGEAFMVHSHPQWLRAREIAASEEFGDLRSIIGAFSYFNRDPRNIRNVPAYGGGAIMDIGCYPITMSRFLFRQEPRRVLGLLDRDPEMGTDRLSSAILEFPGGHSIFTCSTQLVPYQRMNIMGTRASIELPIPFNAPPDRPTELFVDTGADLFGGGRRREEFPVCDQYTIQGDLFSRAIRENAEVPSSIEDGVWNMAVLDALFRSSQSGHWEAPVALV
ncbi:MAG TPA: Gfo/Idh/MocA family oxidoreductase, partial [Bryobacteraceae bacterium]|nr:Gfo/Idh/MocA family oxidoreductase [Bryobacteraceae bacterium]